MLVGFIEIDVVASDTGGDTKLEILCLPDEVGSEVSWVEGSRDKNLSLLVSTSDSIAPYVNNVLLEDAVGALLVVRHDQSEFERRPAFTPTRDLAP